MSGVRRDPIHGPRPPWDVKGEPSRIQLAEVVTINTDGSVDAKLLGSRSVKAAIQVPGWYVPRGGDRVLVTDLDGDPRRPLCLGYMGPKDGDPTAPQMASFGRRRQAGPFLLDSTSLSAGGVTGVINVPHNLGTTDVECLGSIKDVLFGQCIGWRWSVTDQDHLGIAFANSRSGGSAQGVLHFYVLY